jgi:cyclophilin family peptidyl-prolyl cis-trans isomerase
VGRTNSFTVEGLESRTLLSAVATASLGNMSVNPASMPSIIDLGGDFADPQVTGPTVLVRTSNGNIPMELLDSVAPATAANFLRYVNGNVYNGTLFHRTVTNFIDQAGGFNTDGSAITNFGMIQNEFHVSNTRGTVAMVKLPGNPNSASNQWFINLADNSGTLDSQNGGFTVFAQVLYNGMAVADAINQLPTVDASQLTSALPAKPDDPLPVQNAAGGVAASNLVEISSAAVVPSLAFNATSDDPTLVSASIAPDGHTLALSYAAGQTGIAHIAVTATDLGGGSVTQNFQVNVGVSGDLLTVVVGKGAAKMVAVKQSDGTLVNISLKGPGMANVQVLGDGLQQTQDKNGTILVSGDAASVFNLVTTGTTMATSLNVTTKGAKTAFIGGIVTDAPLGNVIAKTSDLTGNLTAQGSMRSLILHGASNANIFSGDSVLSVPAIGSINIAGALDHVEILTAGNVGSVSAASMSNSELLAGVNSIPQDRKLPASVSDFTATASIAALRIKGLFSNTNVAARQLGKLALGQIQTANGGSAFGLASHTIAALSGVIAADGKKVVIRKLSDPAKAAALESSLGLQDFELNML